MSFPFTADELVDNLFAVIQNIVAGTASHSVKMLNETCLQWKIELSSNSPIIIFHYEQKCDEIETVEIVPVTDYTIMHENSGTEDDENASKQVNSITLDERREDSLALNNIKQELLLLLNNYDENKDKNKGNKTKSVSTVMNSYPDSISSTMNSLSESVDSSSMMELIPVTVSESKMKALQTEYGNFDDQSKSSEKFGNDNGIGRKKVSEDFPYVYKLPQFPLWLQTMLNTRSPLCKEPKCRRAVTDALFDDLLRYGYYPTSRMFQETSRALVETYPILKDKQFANAQPHDSWVLRLRDKFKKYRSRHAELCNAEELNRMKAKFGNKRDRSRSDTDNGFDDSLTSVKRMKVPLLSKCAEDQFAINVHIKVLQEEWQKQKPNDVLIRDIMAWTFEHRTVYITTHSVAETLTCFPPLQQTNELLNEAKRLGISEAVLREFLIMKKNSLSQLAQKRKQKNRRLSQLLTTQAECACTEDSELAFTILVLPCLMQENFPLLYAEEHVEISVLQPVIVHRNSFNVFNNSSYELFLDKQLVTKTENLVTAATLWFTLFWLFDIGYSRNHVKLLSFFDTFVFKKCSLTSVPRSVKSLFNAI